MASHIPSDITGRSRLGRAEGTFFNASALRKTLRSGSRLTSSSNSHPGDSSHATKVARTKGNGKYELNSSELPIPYHCEYLSTNAISIVLPQAYANV